MGNKIVFLNSFKMKISIIIGVLHMMFGVLMSLWNNKYFGKTVNIIHEFLPQLIFLTCMFGNMALLMLHKWTAFTAGGFDGDILTTERCAPSILITFINMVLFKDNAPDSPECEAYMYMGQSGIQHLLVLVAVICIPWMLLVKPLINKNKPKLPGEETDFTEVMILQASTRSSTSWAPCPTQHPTCVSGRSAWHTRSSVRCSGPWLCGSGCPQSTGPAGFFSGQSLRP